MGDTLTNYILNHDTAEQTLLASSYATDQEAIHKCNIDTRFPVLITSLGVNNSKPGWMDEPVQAISRSTLKLKNYENTKDNHDNNKHKVQTTLQLLLEIKLMMQLSRHGMESQQEPFPYPLELSGMPCPGL